MRRIWTIIIICFLLINVGFISTEGNNANSGKNSSNMISKPLAPLIPHGKIRINSNTEFFNMDILENWEGTGMQNDPIIIENYEINAQGSGACIYIGNVTTVYFIIRNCKLYNATGTNKPLNYGTGITLNNVPNTPYPKGILQNNNCSNNDVGILLYGTNFCLIENNTCSNNSEMGILVESSDDNVFRNNTCSNNIKTGLKLKTTQKNVVENNRLLNNTVGGIELNNSILISVSNNTCNQNNMNGILLTENSDNNTLINNTCLNNTRSGISLEDYSSDNFMLENIVNTNQHSGIALIFSDDNTIRYNICINQSNGSGIYLEQTRLCKVLNNTCLFNKYGIYLDEADTNNVSTNICQNNSDGILLLGSDNNNIFTNTLTWNFANGIKFIDSSAVNYIKFNNISNNPTGINITLPGLKSVMNFFSYNLISYNSKFGIFIDHGDNNQFYYNNIMYNQIQAVEFVQLARDSSNQWNNNYNEGNFWSDYTGLDNGSGGRVAGDGIGDTALPHLDLDSYPFTDKDGWHTINPPLMYDPGAVNITGSYTVFWETSLRAISYYLVEDVSNSFDSPTVVFYGQGVHINISNKQNGTYYYRLKIATKIAESLWSNIVDIIVDHPPSGPTGLNVSNVTGQNITLQWNLNPEIDVAGYHVLVNDTGADSLGPFHQIVTVDDSTSQFKLMGLIEETTYYFVITAFDNLLSNSTNSNITSATTSDETPPDMPKNLSTQAVSNTEIQLNWNASKSSDIAGYLIFSSKGVGNSSFQLLLDTMDNQTSYLVKNLDEKVTYNFKIKAYDEVPNNSPFSNVATATTLDITPPTKPMGLNVTIETYYSLTLTWEPNPEIDVVGYFLYRTEDQTEEPDNLTYEPITDNLYLDTDVNESTTYYYRLLAIDDVGLFSQITDYVKGTTLLSPKPPKIEMPVSNFSINEDTIDDSTIDLYGWFSDPNDDQLKFSVEGNDHINVKINQTTGSVILTPGQNWNGKETLTFYANDSAKEISDPVTITVIAVNDEPGPAEILSPADGLEIKEGESVSFSGQCDDPDLPYGDILSFTWHSDRDGELGKGQKLTDIKLSVGKHIITLEVVDTNWTNATNIITITVKEIKDKDPEGLSSIFLPLIFIVVLIIIVVIVILLFRSKRKPAEYEEEEMSPPEVEDEGGELERVEPEQSKVLEEPFLEPHETEETKVEVIEQELKPESAPQAETAIEPEIKQELITEEEQLVETTTEMVAEVSETPVEQVEHVEAGQVEGQEQELEQEVVEDEGAVVEEEKLVVDKGLDVDEVEEGGAEVKDELSETT